MELTSKDVQQLKDKGISREQLEDQIKNFKTGFPFLTIQKAATVGDGIQRISESETEQYIEYYDQQSAELQVFKFVPASGAASRMFKALFAYMQSYAGSDAEKTAFANENGFYTPAYFFKKLKDFAFYSDLKNTLSEQGKDLETLVKNHDFVPVLEALLTEVGLNYGGLPKALLAFHHYGSDTRTPIEEHLVEGANYAKGNDGKVYLHFTVSPEHKTGFEEKLAEVRADYEEKLNATFEVSLSIQQPYTDTVAVDLEDNPFRLEDGSILFRPGGHGALIENLNALNADVVFIKNIDNVVPESLQPTTFKYKKLLGGVLLKYQEKIFNFAKALEENPTEKVVNEVVHFYNNDFSTVFTEDFEKADFNTKVAYLLDKLNRPIRACGMVKNEGEPGGGPFWALNNDGSTSLQIVESSQINSDDPTQKEIMQNASHFNPVDLVCSLKNHHGVAFDLLQHRDPKTGFIAMKSKDGRELKAQELPGLWNGAMSDWNTVFVEVPLETFNPVKQVNDLLREQHQK